MKKILIPLLLLPLALFAQTKTTQKVQLVVAIHAEKNKVDALYALAAVKKDQKVLQDCSQCKYFLGELSGSYEQKGVAILPKVGATITVFKEQEVFAEKTAFPTNGFRTKNELLLGNTKATVIENKKGKLILKTKNNEK